MPTITTGTFFVRKTRPVEAARDADGFRLTLRLVDKQGPGAAEPYVVTWRGPEAEAWHREHGADLTPGRPLQISVANPRSFPGLTGPETRGTVMHVALAPLAPSWQARAPGADPATHGAQPA